MSTTKPFDYDLYQKSDPIAKEAMINWLDKNNFININQKETMSFDIVCNKLETDLDAPIKHFYEVEIWMEGGLASLLERD